MAPAKYDFVNKSAHYEGDTFSIPLTFENVDLTGSTVTFTIREQKDDASPIYTADYTNADFTISDGSTTLDLKIPGKSQPLFPASLVKGFYFYDVQVVFPSTDISTFLAGRLEVVDDVTK